MGRSRSPNRNRDTYRKREESDREISPNYRSITYHRDDRKLDRRANRYDEDPSHRSSESKSSRANRISSREHQRDSDRLNDYVSRDEGRYKTNTSRSNFSDSGSGGGVNRSRSPVYETRNRGLESSVRRQEMQRERLPEKSRDESQNGNGDLPDKEKEGPNFGLSGLLVAETNTFNGVVIKYNEPPESIKPKTKWRWYVFKNDEKIDMLHLYRQSAYLIGKERRVADIPMDHVSISSQHAVLQYRKVQQTNPDGSVASVVKPYIIDLDSTNGTFVNDVKIPKSRYVELKAKDVLKFGCSTREYVFLKEE